MGNATHGIVPKYSSNDWTDLSDETKIISTLFCLQTE
jgi:hypothetical protein